MMKQVRKHSPWVWVAIIVLGWVALCLAPEAKTTSPYGPSAPHVATER